MGKARVLLVAGARPNFMKIAALHRAIRGIPGIRTEILHTGQHASEEMSGKILHELALPEPDHAIDLGAPAPVFVAARLIVRIGEVLEGIRPDLVVVVGDVTSTAAAALAAACAGIPVAHVEAGLRSFDRTMPEEVNRLLTDGVSSLLFTTEESANRNLVREGIDPARICFAGNVMVDTLRRFLPLTDLGTPRAIGVEPGAYALVTVHRAGNVDRAEVLGRLSAALGRAAERLPVVFPVHPRTKVRIREAKIDFPAGVRLCPPLSYLAFVDMLRRAAVVLTDSGGVQEEAAALGVPCVTLRDATERPVTIDVGANRLAGTDPEKIAIALDEALATKGCPWPLPPLWDGHAAERIADRIAAFVAARRGGG